MTYSDVAVALWPTGYVYGYGLGQPNGGYWTLTGKVITQDNAPLALSHPWSLPELVGISGRPSVHQHLQVAPGACRIGRDQR